MLCAILPLQVPKVLFKIFPVLSIKTSEQTNFAPLWFSFASFSAPKSFSILSCALGAYLALLSPGAPFRKSTQRPESSAIKYFLSLLSHCAAASAFAYEFSSKVEPSSIGLKFLSGRTNSTPKGIETLFISSTLCLFDVARTIFIISSHPSDVVFLQIPKWNF